MIFQELKTRYCPVAQMVEHAVDNRMATGSSPVGARPGFGASAARLFWKQEAAGAAPAIPTNFARVTQLVECQSEKLVAPVRPGP